MKLPITGLVVGEVSPAVVVCGDPDRATKMAGHLQDAELLTQQREYRAYRGLFSGVPITVCSHGVGAPGAAVAFEELIAAGAQQIIRVGTCGGVQAGVQTGQLVVAVAAVQNTGYGRETVPFGYPAVADPELTVALKQTTAESGHPHHTGLVITRDNFYPGVKTAESPDYSILASANVLAVEMECAALFVVGSLRGAKTAAILAVDGNVLHKAESMETYNPHHEAVHAAVQAEIQIALKTLVVIGDH